MKLRYNYRLYPTEEQEQKLKQTAGNTRWLWNYFLELNIKEYETNKKFIFYNDMAKLLTQLKKEHTWLSDTFCAAMQQKLRDLDLALKVKKYNRGFPKFKAKWNASDSFRYVRGIKIIDNKILYLSKIGDIKIKLHRDLPNYSSVTIKQEGDKWYASFVVEVDVQSIKKITDTIGIDINANNITDSNGNVYLTPRLTKQQKDKLKRLQQSVSRKQKKSSNRRKAIKKLKEYNLYLRNRRKDFIHKTSARIAKAAQLVSVKTLDIEKMKQNHLVAKAIQDNEWASFIKMIEYKCKLIGHTFHQINKWLPSSKKCHKCGNKKKELDLSIRTYRCDNDECGYVGHRDLNAAININEYGKEVVLKKSGQELSKVPLYPLLDVLSSDGITNTQVKKEIILNR